MQRLRRLKSLALVAAIACPLSLGCRSSGSGEQRKAESTKKIQPLVRYRVPLHQDELSLGPKQAKVTIVVFSNYACTPCRRTWEVMRHLHEVYGDKLRVIHRSVSIKGYAANETAVDAALAANAQGKFWEMHWRLFAHAQDLSRPVLKAHARELGLDLKKFDEDMDTGAFTARRLRDQRAQEFLGVSAGPISFVNGVLVVGYRSEQAWHELVDHELAVARRELKEGVKPGEMYAHLQRTAIDGPIRLGSATQKNLPKAKPKAKAPGQDIPQKNPDPSLRYQVRGNLEHGVGPKDAPVLVVEFTDFQCPYCKAAHNERFGELRNLYKGKLRWESRNLPLPIHPSAPGAARAAWAAGKQGKYWAYHEGLMSSGSRLGQRRFAAIAQELGLDLERFKSDQSSREAKEAIKHDEAFAMSLGVNATPSIFVNGRFLPGLRSLATYKSLIDDELAKVQASGLSGRAYRDQVFAKARKSGEFPNPWPKDIAPAPSSK